VHPAALFAGVAFHCGRYRAVAGIGSARLTAPDLTAEGHCPNRLGWTTVSWTLP
jgi:hypothetical protein